MGEGFGNYRICDDEALMSIISSANVACGFHAGDPIIMDRMVRLAKQKGVDNLIPVLTAENVELPLLLTRLSKSERRERVVIALKVVGLGDRASTIRASSPAVRSSASPSPAPSSPIRRCSSPTSRPATSTQGRPTRC